MPSNAEYQEAFRERKRAENERRQFEQFVINASFSSSTTDAEKYEKFLSHRQTVKVNERKRKQAEAARERRKKRKKKKKLIPDEILVTKSGELKEEIRKRRRAEGAREKYKQKKLRREQRAREEQPNESFKWATTNSNFQKHISDSLFFHAAEEISSNVKHELSETVIRFEPIDSTHNSSYSHISVNRICSLSFDQSNSTNNLHQNMTQNNILKSCRANQSIKLISLSKTAYFLSSMLTKSMASIFIFSGILVIYIRKPYYSNFSGHFT